MEKMGEKVSEDIEYCQYCLDGKCEDHEWFGKPKTEGEIIINTLKMVSDILPSIIEKVYLLETVLRCRKSEERGIFFGNGKIDFVIEATTASHKKNGYEYYIPVDSYTCGKEGVVDFHIEIEAIITRHNPMTLRVYENMLCAESIFTVHLINEDDFLHCEEIRDHNEIVDITKQRLYKLIEDLTEKKEKRKRLNS